MPKVFISYATETDSDFAGLMQTTLRENGIDAWLDRDQVRAGDNWRDSIDKGISASDVLIVVLSEKSSVSSYVTFEWAYALGLGAKVVPVQLQKCKKHERLESLQHLDFTNPKVRPWDALFEEIRRAKQVEAQRADGVMQLAIESYMDKLILRFRTTHFGGSGGLGSPSRSEHSPTVRFAYAFGTNVQLDFGKRGEEARSQLSALVERIAHLRLSRERQIKDDVLHAFREVQGSAEFITQLLDRVRYGGTTLAEPWRGAQQAISRLWQDKSQALILFQGSELDFLRRFLEQHAEYQNLAERERQEVESFLFPGNLTIDDLLNSTRSELKKVLNQFIASQGGQSSGATQR